MVGVDGVLQDTCTCDARAERFADPVVVDTPSCVALAGTKAVTPPTVLLGAGVEEAERVNHAAVLPSVHPFALFGKEAADADLPLGVVDVDGLVADIVVAADDDVGARLAQQERPFEEGFEEVHLELLTDAARGAAGDIDADHRDVAEIGAEHAPFAVVAGVAHARDDAVGLHLAEDCHARIALLLGGVDVTVVAEFLHGEGVNLLGLRLALLYAEDVGALLPEPVEEPFADGGADTVEVVGDNLHWHQGMTILRLPPVVCRM